MPESPNHDAFISYAHRDNLPLGLSREGWVTEFAAALRSCLHASLGRKPLVWYDPQLSGNVMLGPGLSDELSRSALLITVVSPAYSDSVWCRRELDTFVENCRGEEWKSRVIRISKLPVSGSRLNLSLEAVRTHVFYELDSKYGLPHEVERNTASYVEKLSRLASDVTETLEVFHREMTRAAGGTR